MNRRFFCRNCKEEAVFDSQLINEVLTHNCICQECGKEIILQEKREAVGWTNLSEEAVFPKGSILEISRRGKERITIGLIKL